jgi:phosphohistidine phosphatase
LVRTSQTAGIIAAAFTHASLSAVQALQPGSTVAAVDEAVSRFIDFGHQQQHMLLVSHQPLVSHLVEHYLGEGSSVPFLSPGGLVTLSMEVLAPACGRLLFWAFPPEYEAGV